jgi:hypothetical protein
LCRTCADSHKSGHTLAEANETIKTRQSELVNLANSVVAVAQQIDSNLVAYASALHSLPES